MLEVIDRAKTNGKSVLPFGNFLFFVSTNGILKQPFRNHLLSELVLSRFDNFVGLQISQLNSPDRFQFKTKSVMEFVAGDKLGTTAENRNNEAYSGEILAVLFRSDYPVFYMNVGKVKESRKCI